MQPRKKLARRLAAVGGALVVGTAGLVALTGAPAGATVTNIHFASYVAAGGGWSTLDQSTDITLTPDTPVGPNSNEVQQGAGYTMVTGASTQVIPSMNGNIPVIQAGLNSFMYPVPAGVTVGTITAGTWTFTDVNHVVTTGNDLIQQCTTYGGAFGTGCSATATGSSSTLGAFQGVTGSPYLSIGTGSALFTAGGTLVQTPSTIHFTDTGSSTIVQTVSEFQTSAIVTLFGNNVTVPVSAFPTATPITTAENTTNPAPILDTAQGGQSVATLGVQAPPAAPILAPQSATVSAGQSVTINVLAGATEVSDTPNPASVVVTTAPQHGTVTNNGNGTVTYFNTQGDVSPTDSFAVTAAGTNSGKVSAPVTESIAVSFNQCSAGSGTPGTSAPPLGTCSLHQELLLPVMPGNIILSQAGGLPIDLMGSAICSQTLVPGITLNGKNQQACGALSPLTVTNATGLDAGWTLTAQTTDFQDPNHGATPPTCDTPATYNNHCIPGGNLDWLPVAAVAHTIVPGDTAQVAPGTSTLGKTPVLTPAANSNPIVNALFGGAAVQANPVLEPAPFGGLTTPQTLCSTASGQAGGTFICGAALTLDIPASIAEPGVTATGITASPQAPGYVATVTLTLS